MHQTESEVRWVLVDAPWQLHILSSAGTVTGKPPSVILEVSPAPGIHLYVVAKKCFTSPNLNQKTDAPYVVNKYSQQI